MLNYLKNQHLVSTNLIWIYFKDYNNGYTLFSLLEMAYAIDLIKPVYGDDPDGCNYYYIASRDDVYGAPAAELVERKQSVKTRGGRMKLL